MTTFTNRRSAAIVEVVGPPGSGKSTLVACLKTLVDVAVIDRPPRAGSTADRGSGLSSTTASARSRIPRAWRWNLRLVYLSAVAVTVTVRPRAGLVVFDQGPVFTMARLLGERSDGPSRWVKIQQRFWARRLDGVVVLNACDEVLLERIDARSKHHRVKGAPRSQAVDAVSDERAAINSTVVALSVLGVRTIEADTTAANVTDTARQVLEFMAVGR